MRTRSIRSFAASSLVSLAALSTNSSGQTGPFVEGELLVRSPNGVLDHKAIYRINPVTGHGENLVDDLYPQNAPGWLAYEPVRDRLLGYLHTFPTPFPARLYSIAADGTLRSLGFEGADLTSFAPTGDGRVYMNRQDALHMLTAEDELVPVLDAAGEPFDLYLPHLAYDVGTNSLIGISTHEGDSPCFESWHVQAHRLPLTPDGTQLSGPIACAGFDTSFSTAFLVGLDPLPNGNYLISTSWSVGPAKDMFIELDPDTLAFSVWSTSTISTIDGGVYTPQLGKVVALRDDNQSDELRVFAQGQGGAGTPLPVDVPVGDSQTGNSDANVFLDVNTLGAQCGGYAEAFGSGLAGTGASVPKLHAGGCPRIGATFTFDIWHGVGGSAGLVMISPTFTTLPVLGGTLYVLPPFAVLSVFTTSGAAGAAGVGSASVPQPVPANPALIGVPFFAQALLVDAAAPEGYSLSNGLGLTVGP